MKSESNRILGPLEFWTIVWMVFITLLLIFGDDLLRDTTLKSLGL